MAELKTKKNKASVELFLRGIADDDRRRDCRTLVKVMQEIIGDKPAMWGPSIVGFGNYRYQYASGREGEWFLIGFSPRKQNLTLYAMSGFEEFEPLMAKLGTFKTGKSCLYVKRLDDVHLPTLKKLLRRPVRYLATYEPTYGSS